MKAMIMERIRNLEEEPEPLSMVEFSVPSPGPSEVLIKVSACGVCHTELDEIEGRTPPPSFPVIPGHQVVGIVEETGEEVRKIEKGARVGVAWIFSACGRCEYCTTGRENLCSDFKATGRDVHGGYAEYMVAPSDFVVRIPEEFTDSQAAPLLCAGAIGYRSIKLTDIKDGQFLGLTGFGASGHLVLKFVRALRPSIRVFVFARSRKERQLALELGADWAGDTAAQPPEKLHAIIDTTPAWKPVTEAMKQLRPGGRLVINAIRKESDDQAELMNLRYHDQLWMEKEIKSVANITRHDVREFLDKAAQISIKPVYEEYPLEKANKALLDLKQKKIRGAKVLVV